MAAYERGELVGVKLGQFAAVRWLHCGIDGGAAVVIPAQSGGWVRSIVDGKTIFEAGFDLHR